MAYSVDEAAQLTGLSRDLLYDQMRRGNLTCVKIGRRRLITRHHLDGDELTTALQNTANHRGIQLRPLSEAISDLATRRQAPYAAWRRRQGNAAENHPSTFADLVTTVTTFADPLAAGTAHGRTWDPATRAWQAT